MRDLAVGCPMICPLCNKEMLNLGNIAGIVNEFKELVEVHVCDACQARREVGILVKNQVYSVGFIKKIMSYKEV